MWASGADARDGDSSVSSGRLSGSSGGHEACPPPCGTWKERPPQVLGPQRQPRRSDPRLEQLRDRIRAQAQWQGSCASLGTSALSSTSAQALRRKTCRVACGLPAPTQPGRNGQSTAEHRTHGPATLGRVRELSRASQPSVPSGPREKCKRARSCSCRTDPAPRLPAPGKAAKGRDPEAVGVYAWRRGQAAARSLLGPPPRRLQKDSKKATTASSSSTRVPRAVPAHSHRQVSEPAPSQVSCDQPTMIHTAMETLQDLRQQIQAGLDLARGPREGQKPKTKLKPEASAGMRPQGPGSTPAAQDAARKCPWAPLERRHSSPGCAGGIHCRLPCSPSATWQSRLSREPPRSPSFQRPWSTCLPQARAASEAWGTPWSPPERPRAAPLRPWSSSSVLRAGTTCKDRSTGRPPSGAKQAWPGPTRAVPAPSARPAAPCPRLQEPLGRLHSSESLRDIIRQRALQAKASAARALELRSQRLQEVYRQQEEAVLGKAIPLVSQTTPGIVTFVPSTAQSGGVDAPESLGSPVQEWSKVTSGVVRGDQEAPGSFCLCLNRPWGRTEALQPGRLRDAAPLLHSASLGALRLQDLPRGLCVYLDPQEAERLGTASPRHWTHKLERLRALETMADVLRQRVDILSTKLHHLEAPPWDLPPSGPEPAPAATAGPGAIASNGGRGVDVQAGPFPDAEMLLWNPCWEPCSLSPGSPFESRSPGVDGRPWELQRRLQRHAASFQALRTLVGSSLPAALDRTCEPLWLEEPPAATTVAGLGAPWSSWSCGDPEPSGLHLQDLQGGHLVNMQLKSACFLESLKQQQKAEALALLQQRAEQELWATEAALDTLRFKRQLQLGQGGASSPSSPTTPTMHRGARRPAAAPCQPSPLDDPGPQVRGPGSGSGGLGGRGGQPGRGDSGGPGWTLVASFPGPGAGSQPPPSGEAVLARRLTGPGGAEPRASRTFGRFTFQMLEQSLREEKLRAQHQAALLRLREMALEERTRAELAWLQHQRGYLGCEGDKAAWAALAERQQQALSNLEKGKKEIRQLRDIHLSMHRDRTLLLRHQKDILAVQRSTACLWRELHSQGAGPRPWRSPDSAHVPAPTAEQTLTTPTMASDAVSPLQPPGPEWGEDGAEGSGLPAESDCHVDQGLGAPHGLLEASDPRALPATLHLSLLGLQQHQPLGLVFAVRTLPQRPSPFPCLPYGAWKAAAVPGASVPGPGDPRSKPSPCLAEEPGAWTGSCMKSFLDQHWLCLHGEGPCVAEGRTSREGPEEPQAPESRQSGPQRIEAPRLEEPGAPLPQLGATPVRVHPQEVPAAQCLDSPWPQPTTPMCLNPESAPGTPSEPWEAPGSTCTSWASSTSGHATPSLPGFCKATAVLVQLSDDSAASVCSAGAEHGPHTGGGGPSLEAPGLPLSAAPEGPGGAAWWAGPCGDSCVEAAAVGSSEPEHGPLSGSWSLPLPDAPSAGSGSELSEASSHVWDEHSWEPCPGPGHLRDAETSSPDPGALQEDSRTCDGLAIRSKAGETKRASTGEACPAVTSHTSSSRLSLTSASAEPAPQQERPQHATPQVPPTAHAPSGGPCGRAGGGRSTQEAGALQADHILTEILSPVDEQLSYGSADLPSSSLRDAGLPAGLQADSHAKAAGPYLEDGVLPQGWPAPLGPPGEDTCAAHLSSPSREEPELSLEPFGQGVPGDPGAAEGILARWDVGTEEPPGPQASSGWEEPD
ncbi:coiled-coil domain-containing protein 187 [Ochotona curzoniae]|uniref:coiled-coil domain-containing protein 187 n=1 Tax=Ochotona curzoniae TaxID=130825 RepID=UPI001B34C0BB|nr:coiled-coil domain-containing protein 187 [Ochotona curzoniae]